MPSVKCPGCNTEYDIHGGKPLMGFCTHCGSELPHICNGCGEIVESGEGCSNTKCTTWDEKSSTPPLDPPSDSLPPTVVVEEMGEMEEEARQSDSSPSDVKRGTRIYLQGWFITLLAVCLLGATVLTVVIWRIVHSDGSPVAHAQSDATPVDSAVVVVPPTIEVPVPIPSPALVSVPEASVIEHEDGGVEADDGGEAVPEEVSEEVLADQSGDSGDEMAFSPEDAGLIEETELERMLSEWTYSFPVSAIEIGTGENNRPVRSIWWRSSRYRCVLTFKIEGEWALVESMVDSSEENEGWMYINIDTQYDRYLFLSSCMGDEAIIARIPSGYREHHGQSVVQGPGEVRAYLYEEPIPPEG